MISFITTCKNRLAHLQQSLPLMLQQSSAEVIVVDYGCEQGTADWVKQNYPQAKVVRVSDDPRFCIARARNLGAAQAAGEFLCFIDADVLINADLGQWVQERARTGHYYLSADRRNNELGGTVVCRKEDYERVGGYDEAFRGWGSEDADFYERLGLSGLTADHLPAGAMTVISHGNDIRQLGREDPGGYATLREALALGELYRLAKMDISRLVRRDLDLEFRKELFRIISETHQQAKHKGQKEFRLAIAVPPEAERNRYAKSRRSVTYDLPVI